MDFKIVAKKIPAKPTEPEKYYASIVRPKKVTLEMLAKRISEVSPVNELDTETTLVAFTRILPEFLANGASVELGDLGYLRVDISSRGADTEEEFDKDLIKGNKVSYQASSKVKKVLKNVEYTRV